MTRIILRKPSSKRRQPLLTKEESLPPTTTTTSGGVRLGEVAGGAAAECAAVCCCCPCGLVNLLVLAVYKLPAGLCKKALKKKRRKQLMNAGIIPRSRPTCRCGCDETELQIRPVSIEMLEVEEAAGKLNENEVMKLEKEMWDRFYGTGFWRSPSQRDC